MMNWAEFTRTLPPEVGLQNPASDEQMKALEAFVGQPLPPRYVSFLRHSNGLVGHSDLIFSAENAITTNEVLVSNYVHFNWAELYMPFGGMFFIGMNADGDYFFLRMLKGQMMEDVYRWEHESDSRVWFARDVQDFLARYFAEGVAA